MVFFCKGTVETLKKFSWAPDIIHCHGWMTGLIPSYIRTAYKTDPLFHASKIIYSLYDTIPQPFALEEFYHKASINNLTADDMVAFQDGDEANIHKGAAIFSDGIIRSSDLANESVLKMLESIDKPIMEYDATKGVDKDYIAFYQRVESMDTVVTE
jgi:starch synthase